MGARPSGFKRGGGGFLNQVDGVISGYEFTDEFNGKPYDPAPVKGKVPFHGLQCLLSVRVDGAEEDTTTTLFVGGYDDFTIVDDGHTLFDSAYETEEDAIEAGSAARSLGANTAFGKLITSLVEAGFPETNLPEDRINYESIIGTRVRFVQRKDEESTKKLGKRVDPKTKKEYDRQTLVVEQVYSLPGTSAPTAAGKAAPKGKAAAAAKGAKKAVETVDVSEVAGDILKEALMASGGTLSKAKANMAVYKLVIKHAQKDAIRKFLMDDANIASIEGIDFDGTNVSIAA